MVLHGTESCNKSRHHENMAPYRWHHLMCKKLDCDFFLQIWFSLCCSFRKGTILAIFYSPSHGLLSPCREYLMEKQRRKKMRCTSPPRVLYADLVIVYDLPQTPGVYVGPACAPFPFFFSFLLLLFLCFSKIVFYKLNIS
jgi:hypothetical protein